MLRLVGLMLCVVASVAAAEPWQVEPSLTLGIENFDYHEDVTGAKSAHHGTQPTGRIEALAITPNPRIYARLTLGLTGGTMPFDGTDQTGAPITPADDAGGHMTDAELVVGYRRTPVAQLWLGAYAGFGRRTWDRDLRPIGPQGYREDYAWWLIPVGLTAEYAITPEWSATLEVTAMVPIPGTMRLHLSDFDATYSDLDVALNNQTDPRFRLRTEYAIDRLRLIAVATYELSWMLQGPGTPLIVNGMHTDPELFASEPETHTRRLSLLAGIGWTF